MGSHICLARSPLARLATYGLGLKPITQWHPRPVHLAPYSMWNVHGVRGAEMRHAPLANVWRNFAPFGLCSFTVNQYRGRHMHCKQKSWLLNIDFHQSGGYNRIHTNLQALLPLQCLKQIPLHKIQIFQCNFL